MSLFQHPSRTPLGHTRPPDWVGFYVYCRMRNTFRFSTLKAPFAIWKNLYSWSSRSMFPFFNKKIFWHIFLLLSVFFDPTWLGNFEGFSILLTPLRTSRGDKNKRDHRRGRRACQKTLSPLPHTPPVLPLLFAPLERDYGRLFFYKRQFIFFFDEASRKNW